MGQPSDRVRLEMIYKNVCTQIMPYSLCQIALELLRQFEERNKYARCSETGPDVEDPQSIVKSWKFSGIPCRYCGHDLTLSVRRIGSRMALKDPFIYKCFSTVCYSGTRRTDVVTCDQTYETSAQLGRVEK